MRKLAIVILVVVAVAVIVALVLPSFLDVNRYHDRIQAELQKKLARPVSLGPMHLSLLPLAFRVENAVIGDDPAFRSERPFAQAQELYVTAKLMPLLQGDVQMDSLELRQPQIELIRNAEGVWNFASLGHAAPAAASAERVTASQRAPEAAPAQPAAQQPAKPFTIADVSITDGQVALTDLQKRQPRAVYDHIDLRVSGYEPGKAFDIDAAAHLPGQGAQKIQFSGKAGPVPAGTLTNMPFDGTVKLDQVSVSAVQKFLNTHGLAGIEAIVSGEAKLRNDAGKVATSGTLKAEQARVRGTDIGYTISLDYDLSNDLNTNVLQITRGNVKLGATPLSVTGTVDTTPTPARVDVKVSASSVSIEEAARLAASLGLAFNPGMKIAGKMNADIRAQGPATGPVLNGTLSAQNLSIAGKDLPSPVQVQGIDLALSPQSIRSNSFTASTGSTTLAAQFTLSDYTSPSSSVDLTLHAAEAKIGELINIAKAYGVSAVEGMSGTGSMALDVRATGPLKNTAAMTFSGSGSIRDASLTVPQITKPLQVRNAGLRFTQNSVIFDNLNASLGSTSATGSLTLRNFAEPQLQFTLNADRMLVAEWQQMFPTVQPAKQAGFSLVPRAYAAEPQPSLFSKMTGAGTLTVGTILYDQMVLNNVRSSVALDHGVVRFSPITADLYNGSQAGTIIVDTRPTPSVYTVSTKFDRVDANKLLSSMSSVKQTLYGLLAGNANELRLTGATADQMTRSMNGAIALDMTKGKLVGMDLMHELSNIGRFLGSAAQRPSQGFTNIVRLTGNFDVRDGVAQTNNLKAVLDEGTMAAVGSVNLADQSLNLRVTAVLSKAVSDQVGGTGVGGFMNTTLANSKGELVIPITVKGTFQHPSFSPDMEQIARMKMENMLPSLSNPGALTTGILGAILGQKGQQGQQGQPQPSPTGGLGEILGGVLGGQQKKQQPSQQQTQQQPSSTQQQQQQKGNVFEDILGGILGGQQKKQQPAQQQQGGQQKNPPDQPPQQPQ